MKKFVSLLLVVSILLLVLAACGSKDALAGTWTGDLGPDGVVTWTFDGSGKVKFDNGFSKQDGTCRACRATPSGSPNTMTPRPSPTTLISGSTPATAVSTASTGTSI